MTSNRRRIGLGCGAVLAIFAACACIGIAINTLGPTTGIAVTVAPHTVTPQTLNNPTSAPTAEAVSDPTNGLGATRAALEPRLDDGLLASFAENNRAWYLERQSTTGLDLEDELATLLPPDSQQTDTYPIADGDRTARVYHSDWLAGVFGDDQWGGADPGTFLVTFNASDPVTRIVIATGENP